MAQETKKITELTALGSFSTSTLFVTHDGTGARKATMQQLWRYLPWFYPETQSGATTKVAAGTHNAIYRGKNLGSSVSSAQWTAIADGTFTDMYIGDYWNINSRNYRIVAFDYYMRCGDGTSHADYVWVDGNGVSHNIPIVGDVQKHHVTLMPDSPMNDAPMNATNTTAGGYASSLMYHGPVDSITAAAGTAYYSNANTTTKVGNLEASAEVTAYSATAGTIIIGSTTYYVKLGDCTTTYNLRESGLAQAKDTIIAAFTDAHILGHRKYLVNATAKDEQNQETGVGSGGAWFDSFCELPNEVNMYGAHIVAAVTSNNINHSKYTIDKTQFPLFRYRPDLISNHTNFWLQDIVTSVAFADVSNLGFALRHEANNNRGVRPVFSIC